MAKKNASGLLASLLFQLVPTNITSPHSSVRDDECDDGVKMQT